MPASAAAVADLPLAIPIFDYRPPVPQFKRTVMRCRKCGCRSVNFMAIGCSIQVWQASVKDAVCRNEDCGAGYNHLLMSEARTLAEDVLSRLNGAGLSERLQNWRDHGECGASSEFMARKLGFNVLGSVEHPHDLDDFRRCILLLGHVPELRDRLQDLASCAAPWPRLVAAWDAIETAYLAGSPNLDGPAPEAALLLEEAIRFEPGAAA